MLYTKFEVIIYSHDHSNKNMGLTKIRKLRFLDKMTLISKFDVEVLLSVTVPRRTLWLLLLLLLLLFHQHKAAGMKINLSKKWGIHDVKCSQESDRIPLWKAMDRRWNRNTIYLVSSVAAMMRLPLSYQPHEASCPWVELWLWFLILLFVCRGRSSASYFAANRPELSGQDVVDTSRWPWLPIPCSQQKEAAGGTEPAVRR